MSNYTICIILILGVLFFLAKSYKVTKVNVKFSELNDEQKRRIKRIKPVSFWKAELGTSFEKYSQDMRALINWWHENEPYAKNGFDKVILKVTSQNSVSVFNNAVGRLTRVNKIITFIQLKTIGEEKLTRKKFGKDINDLYYHFYILKYGKDALEKQIKDDKYDIVFTDKLLEDALKNSKVN